MPFCQLNNCAEPLPGEDVDTSHHAWRSQTAVEPHCCERELDSRCFLSSSGALASWRTRSEMKPTTRSMSSYVVRDEGATVAQDSESLSEDIHTYFFGSDHELA